MIQYRFEVGDHSFDDAHTATVNGEEIGDIQVTRYGTYVANVWDNREREAMNHAPARRTLAEAKKDMEQLARKHGWLVQA